MMDSVKDTDDDREESCGRSVLKWINRCMAESCVKCAGFFVPPESTGGSYLRMCDACVLAQS